MKKYILYSFFVAVGLTGLQAQNVSINNDGANPDPSAMLDVSDTASGFLIPRMTAAQRLAISSPANGLMVFQTDNPRGLYMYFTFHGTWTKVLNDSNLNLANVLALGNDAGADSIMNLNALGIGVNPPIHPLHITADGVPQVLVTPSFLTGQDAGISIQGARNASTANQQAQLNFLNYDNDLGSSSYLGSINGVVTNSGTNVGDLVFYNYSDGSSQTEAMRIASSGNVGIGSNIPSSPLHVEASQTNTSFDNNGIYVLNSSTANSSQHAFITARTQKDGGIPYISLDINNRGGYAIGVSQADSTLDFYTFADGSGSPAMSINQDGFVGIGTASPIENMHLSRTGSATFLIDADTDNITESDNPAVVLRQDGGTVTGRLGLEGTAGSILSNSLADGMHLGTTTGNALQLATNSAVRMTVESGGDVGIGTNNPNVLFHINESVGASTNDGAFMDIQNSSGISGSLSGIRFKNNSATTNIRYQGAIFHQWDANGYQFNFALRDNSATDVVDTDDIKMTINESGNVGIGVTNPSTPLAILGNGATSVVGITQNSSSVGGAATMELTTADGSGNQATRLLLRGNSNDADFQFYTGASGSESILMHLESSNGRLGIGLDSPSRKFHVHDASSIAVYSQITTSSTGTGTVDGFLLGYNSLGAVLFNGENSSLNFATNSVYRMYLDASGNLGIGESSPQGRLDVLDNAVIGNLTLGSESTAQTGSSVHAGDGFLTTPWIYANAIEAQGERGASSALITIGNDGNYGANDEVHFVTNGASRMEVKSNGRVLIGGGSSNGLLSVTSDDGDLNSGINLNNSAAQDWYMYQNLTNDLVFRDDGTDRVIFTSAGTVTVNGAIVLTSDQRFKTDVNLLESTLYKLSDLKGITHYWDTLSFPEKGFSKGRAIGVIAQDMQKVFPELVFEDDKGYLHVDYAKFTAVLLQAIKEQQFLIERQNQNNDKQQSEIDELREELKQLKEELK